MSTTRTFKETGRCPHTGRTVVRTVRETLDENGHVVGFIVLATTYDTKRR